MAGMSWLVWVLFESLPALGAILGVALFVLLVYWRRSGKARALLIGLGIAVVLLAMQALVVTNRERAARVLTGIERDIRASRTDALAAALAPNFESQGLGRDEFVAYARRQLAKVRVRWLERWELNVTEAEADRFVASVTYLADVSVEGMSGTPRSSWRFVFVRTPAGWRISGIECQHVDGHRELSWRDLDRH
jgi:hypothetical protein